jgi:hypothetical protein
MTTVLAITFQYSAWQGDEPFHIHAEFLAYPRPISRYFNANKFAAVRWEAAC